MPTSAVEWVTLIGGAIGIVAVLSAWTWRLLRSLAERGPFTVRCHVDERYLIVDIVNPWPFRVPIAGFGVGRGDRYGYVEPQSEDTGTSRGSPARIVILVKDLWTVEWLGREPPDTIGVRVGRAGRRTTWPLPGECREGYPRRGTARIW